ncbi:MAG: MerR family transcriptional regulator [Clostridium sp.]|uniref:MerR family transcriptional regulator n=1 Tax=Clostridium sp. TaxID=1506 RepID=UPI003EE7A989
MYQIKEIAEITNVPQSKIRYYEKEGVLPTFERDRNNIRVFSDKDVELINLVKCLRTIGMPMKGIKQNIMLLLDKKSDLTARDILIEHRDKLEDQKNEIQRYIDDINTKLEN